MAAVEKMGVPHLVCEGERGRGEGKKEEREEGGTRKEIVKGSGDDPC